MRKFYYRIVKNTQGLNRFVNAGKLWMFNRVLLGAIAVTAVVLVIFGAWVLMDTSGFALRSLPADVKWQKEISALAERQSRPTGEGSFDEIFKSIGDRNIFGLIRAKEKNETVQGAIAHLTLVGIIPGATPQAVVEDQATQKTYYLTEGQTIDDMLLEKIEDRRVILRFKDKSLTLTL